MVKVNVPPVLGKILSGGGGELSEFNKLTATARTAIERETYQRLYLNVLFGYSSNWERVKESSGKKKKEEEASFSVENEILQHEIRLVSKDKTPVTVTENVSVIKFMGPPSLEVKEKRIKEPNATAKLAFHFDPAKRQLLVEVKDFSVRETSTQETYSNSLNKALKAAGENMERKFDLKGLIKPFFDTLHIHRLCEISGNEALNMMKIFRNAKMAYPIFAKLGYADQIGILHEGFERGRTAPFSNRDIHTFAKGTFEVMHMYETKVEMDETKDKTKDKKVGLIDVVYKHDFITNKMMTYRKIAEHKRNRVNGDLLFVDYVYGTANIRTSLSAFDLWDILAKGVRASDASF